MDGIQDVGLFARDPIREILEKSLFGKRGKAIVFLDASGNAVSVTTTINSLYGSLVTVDCGGFLLYNEMADFAAV